MIRFVVPKNAYRCRASRVVFLGQSNSGGTPRQCDGWMMLVIDKTFGSIRRCSECGREALAS